MTSWDTNNKVEQTTYKGGRSFINCVSENKRSDVESGEKDDDCDGAAKNTMGECRMVSKYSSWVPDSIASELNPLGLQCGQIT